jgi:hypothetical protein
VKVAGYLGCRGGQWGKEKREVEENIGWIFGNEREREDEREESSRRGDRMNAMNG